MLSKDFLKTEYVLQRLFDENERLRENLEHMARRLKSKDEEIEALNAKLQSFTAA